MTTLLIGVFDETINKGALLAIGDGVISVNGRIMEFDHNDQPDYIGSHLSEDFEQWFEKHTQKLALSTVRDISIATDGILSFKRFNQETYPAINPIEFLLTDETLLDEPDMLSKKLKSLEHKYGLRPTDDIAVVRYRKLSEHSISVSVVRITRFILVGNAIKFAKGFPQIYPHYQRKFLPSKTTILSGYADFADRFHIRSVISEICAFQC